MSQFDVMIRFIAMGCLGATSVYAWLTVKGSVSKFVVFVGASFFVAQASMFIWMMSDTMSGVPVVWYDSPLIIVSNVLCWIGLSSLRREKE